MSNNFIQIEEISNDNMTMGMDGMHNEENNNDISMIMNQTNDVGRKRPASKLTSDMVHNSNQQQFDKRQRIELL